jgi:hypothetical protein
MAALAERVIGPIRLRTVVEGTVRAALAGRAGP